MKQAFLQINIAEEHRDYLRFIWLQEFNLDENIILRFVNNSLWWNGPNFLINEQLEMPNQDDFATIVDTEKQNDVVTVTVVENKMTGSIGEVIDCSKFGSFEKLLRVIYSVRRFVLNLKTKQIGSPRLQENFFGGGDKCCG